MALLTLGAVDLVGFEVPAHVRFGGAQRVSVHKLIGGGRVIDAMGRDDAVVQWSGVLSGSDASERARTLDAMRASGEVTSLAWDVFCYNVVITELTLKFNNPWWIDYKVQCTVLADLAQSSTSYTAGAADAIVADLVIAAGYSGVAALVGAIPAVTNLAPGSSALLVTASGIAATQASIAQGVASAESALNASDLMTVVNASGSIAQLTAAQGYVDRSALNLQGLLS